MKKVFHRTGTLAGGVVAAIVAIQIVAVFYSQLCTALSPSEFNDIIKGKMILAPLTRGGNLPYRKLCADFGMDVSVSEMVYSRNLIKGDRAEHTRLRRSPNEPMFGVQIAANQIDEGCQAIRIAKEFNADFVDLNCGCPIYEATRRGLGSALLRSPKNLERLVEGMTSFIEREKLDIPLTVKLRLGCSEESINVREVASRMRDAGASAVTIHARTARQGYRRPADWDLIKQVVEDGKPYHQHVPIVGNGDILTYYEARQRMEHSGVDAIMVGRGALIKPWIFQEFKNNCEWEPTLEERVDVYFTLVQYMKEYFGDDDLGRKKTWKFLPWHFSFFTRFKAYPKEPFEEQSLTSPLIHQRIDIADTAPPLEVLLSHRAEETHKLIAAALWDSDSASNAVQRLQQLGESPEFEQVVQKKLQYEEGDDRDGTENSEELANVPPDKRGNRGGRRSSRRPQKPQRTPEEIAQIRAERAAKRARLEAEAAVQGNAGAVSQRRD